MRRSYMARRSTVWRVIAALFSITNLAAAVYAVMVGEATHAAVHVVLMFLGPFVAWPHTPQAGPWPEGLPRAQDVDARLEYLQQSVDAIALEVERIAEAQRYSLQLEAERARRSSPKA